MYLQFDTLLKSHLVTSLRGIPLDVRRYSHLDKNDTLADYLAVSEGMSPKWREFFANAEVMPLPKEGPNVFGVYDAEHGVMACFKVWQPLDLSTYAPDMGFKIAPMKSVAEAVREFEANQGPKTFLLSDFVTSGKYIVVVPESGVTVNASVEEVSEGTAFDEDATEPYTQVEMYWTANYCESNLYFRGDAIVTIEHGVGKVKTIGGEEFEFRVFQQLD